MDCGDGQLCRPAGLRINNSSWAIPLLVISSMNILVIICYEIFIVCQTAQTSPSRRHLFLSQVLLMGLLCGSCASLVYGLEINPTTCIVLRFGTGVSYVLIYSSLLVKLVFLISLNTGVYLPALYQALLLIFCILVQIVVDVEWLSLVPDCHYRSTDHVFSLAYIIFLLVFVASLALKSRNIKDNYREASYIGLLMSINIPLWLVWMIAAIILPDYYHNICFGFGLLATCIITFITMFLPKSRQLTAVGHEGVYIQDLEDDISEDTQYHQYRPLNNKPPGVQYTTKRDSMTTKRDSMTTKRDSMTDGIHQNGSYLGFHRPLGVIPPSSSPPSYRHTPRPWSELPQYQISNFPSHFYPEKLYQYWHYYYPRIPGTQRMSPEILPNVSTLYDRYRTQSQKSSPHSTVYPQNSFYYKYT